MAFSATYVGTQASGSNWLVTYQVSCDQVQTVNLVVTVTGGSESDAKSTAQSALQTWSTNLNNAMHRP